VVNGNGPEKYLRLAELREQVAGLPKRYAGRRNFQPVRGHTLSERQRQAGGLNPAGYLFRFTKLSATATSSANSTGFGTCI
jgi:hypothetical protein